MKIIIFLLITACLLKSNALFAGTLQWSTYFGGNGDEEGRAMATDTTGNVYLTGWTTSTGISTDGSTFSGVYDAFLSKFNKEGKLIWTTYYGGSDMENAFGIAIDKFGGIYICGSTASSNGIATQGAHQTSLAGFTDGFLAKFNSNGVRIWSTYLGGPQNDQALGIAIDSGANVYITGFTLSAIGIATTGAYNTVFGGGRDNGFLAKFDSSGSIKWATYYGGNKNDYSFAVAVDLLGNVYIAGSCSSPDGIATAGAFRTSVGGYYDGFIAKFTNNGDLLWGTYFGNNGDDECEGICTDALGNVYVTGSTSSDSGIATNGAYQTSYSGGYDVFLAKFSDNGTLQWTTYYGGNGDDFGWVMTIGNNGNICISGYTNSVTGIATSGSCQVSKAGMNDAYAAQFDHDGKLIWGSYFGGPDNDYGYAVNTDLSGNIYIAGVTSSSSGIASGAAYSTALSGSTDAFLTKFNNPTSGINKITGNTDDIHVYPNPVTNYATIAYTLEKASFVKMEMFDVTGKLLIALKNEMQPQGNYYYPLDVNRPGLKTGFYYIRISTDYGVAQTDFIKQ